jgi:acid phosphatase
MNGRVLRMGRAGMVLALMWLGAGCAGTAPAATIPPIATTPSLAETKRQVREYVASGRYEADIAHIVGEARAYLERRANGGGKLAIVLDIDETSLTNRPQLEINDYGFIIAGPCDLERGPCGFVAWAQLARAEPLERVVALVRAARERGVAVFFLTGRPERLRAATERNLRAAGYEWTSVLLRPDDLVTKSAAEFKAPERRKLAEQGYTIIVNIGDQMSDLDGGYAERTYKLPNPFYVVP